jgi:predicted acetyltransferase
MPITTRPITEDERHEFRRRLHAAFGGDLDEPELGAERFRAIMPLDRTVAAFDDGRLIGTLGALPFELTVPGGVPLPTAGTTMVSVRSTHRRMGVMRSMMRDHLDDTARRGEPLAALWASEAPIYGRFGFGHATSRDAVETRRDGIRIERPGDGTVHSIEPDEVIELLPGVHDRVRLVTPGMTSRHTDSWTHRVVYDPSEWRDGDTAQRYVVYESDDGIEGYVIYRQKERWTDMLAEGQVKVSEIITATDRAHSALWHYLTNVDLFPTVKYWNLRIDDPLWWKLPNQRLVERRRGDALYVRIIDVAVALEARRYESDGSIRIGVDDPFRPDTSGVYELAVVDGEGKVLTVDAEAEVTLGIDALGALYLGGSNARSMAAAGLIHGAPDAVASLHRLFTTVAAPWCEAMF